MEHKCKKTDLKTVEKCELNAEQIKKALECCAYGLCRDCALYSDDGCGDKVIIGAIELITSQEQRIKELTEALEDTLAINQRYIVERVKNAQPWLKKVNELTQANEMLSESYDHLEKTKDELLAERARLTEENEKLSQSLANSEAENERLRAEGEWLDTGDEELDKIYSGYKCSVCGFIICGHSGKYCCECGAKMKGIK